MAAEFSTVTLVPRTSWNKGDRTSSGNNFQPRILNPNSALWRQNKMFSDVQSLKKLISLHICQEAKGRYTPIRQVGKQRKETWNPGIRYSMWREAKEIPGVMEKGCLHSGDMKQSLWEPPPPVQIGVGSWWAPEERHVSGDWGMAGEKNDRLFWWSWFCGKLY